LVVVIIIIRFDGILYEMSQLGSLEAFSSAYLPKKHNTFIIIDYIVGGVLL